MAHRGGGGAPYRMDRMMRDMTRWEDGDRRMRDITRWEDGDRRMREMTRWEDGEDEGHVKVGGWG